jgi:hypothetical protein
VTDEVLRKFVILQYIRKEKMLNQYHNFSRDEPRKKEEDRPTGSRRKEIVRVNN